MTDEEMTAETPLLELLQSVPTGGGWRTFTENIDDPMAGSHLHGDLIPRAAEEIARLRRDLKTYYRIIAGLKSENRRQGRELEAARPLIQSAANRGHYDTCSFALCGDPHECDCGHDARLYWLAARAAEGRGDGS